MVIWSGSIAFGLGMLFGVMLTVTKPGGIMENKVVYQILDKVINFFKTYSIRNCPYLVSCCLKSDYGNGYQYQKVLPFPLLLVQGLAFLSRQIESALAETDKGMIKKSCQHLWVSAKWASFSEYTFVKELQPSQEEQQLQ